MKPTVGIVGGGILGMTAAYRLAQEGVHVALFERAGDLGGLVGSFDFDGRQVDRFYHVILPDDHRVVGLAEELGLGERFRFRPTKVGFFDDGRLFSMTSPKVAKSRSVGAWKVRLMILEPENRSMIESRGPSKKILP